MRRMGGRRMAKSPISWLATLHQDEYLEGYTFNHIIGCDEVSPACDFCYARDIAQRFPAFRDHMDWGKHGRRKIQTEKYWRDPIIWNRRAAKIGARMKVFCASMGDVFEDHPTGNAQRERLWPLIAATPWLDWLLLTKRPGAVKRMVPWGDDWPNNVWLGVTAENQKWANIRIPILLQIPAKIRFLSCEPLLGDIDLNHAAWGQGHRLPPLDVQARMITPPEMGGWRSGWKAGLTPLRAIDWVICGGESGGHLLQPKYAHRRLNLDDARSLRNQCAAANVPFFFKQIGGRTPNAGGYLLDGRQHWEWPKSPALAAA